MIVPDNATEAELGEEPEGFWDDAHSQVDAWILEYVAEPKVEDFGFNRNQPRNKDGEWTAAGSFPSRMTPREILKKFKFGDQEDGQTQDSILQMKVATSSPALHESIKANGVKEPISVVTTAGGKPYIEDGHHRVVLAMKYHPDTPIKIEYDFQGFQDVESD